MSKGLKILFLLLLISQLCSAQMSWSTFVEDYIFNNEENGNQTEFIYEQLNELRLNPVNLNTASIDQLRQIPFVSQQQVDDIIRYRNDNKEFQTAGELMFINSIDERTRAIIQLFSFVATDSLKPTFAGYRFQPPDGIPPSFRRLLPDSRNEIYARIDYPFYTTEGKKSDSDNPFRGNRMKYKLRYSFQSQNSVFAGVQTEKDEGERDFDYISLYAMLRGVNTGKHSRIHELIVGNFRSNFGLGLALNTGLNYGKYTQSNSLTSIDRGFTPHASFIESNYFTGAALRYQFYNFTFSAYIAHDKLDGNYNADSTGITSIKTDGLHRTALEYSDRHNLREFNYGGNLHLDIGKLSISTTAALTHYSLPLMPVSNTPSSLYRRYNATGQDFQNYSLAYSYQFGKFQFIGETALSHASNEQTGFATLNGLVFRPNNKNSLQLIVRHYGAKYTSIHANAFSENSRPQNEQGVFLSWSSDLSYRWRIYTHLDLMRFPWLKYQVSGTSYGFEYMGQVDYTHSRRSTWLLRYHIKSKQKDYTDDQSQTYLRLNTRQTLKLQNTYTFSRRFSAVTTLNAICITFTGDSPELGFSLSENLRWTVVPRLFSLNGSLTYVDTDTYNSRIYNYEPSLLYSFGINSYYYQAFRTVLVANLTPIRGLTISAKIVYTQYLDHSTIGSGSNKINSSGKSDLQLQARYIF